MKDLLERLRAALADRYAIDREIGRGGTARVYAAQDLRHRRVVALKVLRPEISIMLGADRFLREIEIAARLQHPHVVPLFDSGERDGLVYYVMPLLAGETLRERLAREGRLPIAEVVRLSREVADALGYAHRQGVVHRDVKPENVMLAEGHAFVMDFGVARALYSATQHEGITTAGLSVGTPAYMAPEQASAEPEIDGRADLYALGVIMYEMLAGRPPFRADTVQQVVAAQLATAPEPVERHREDVPPPLAALVRRLLAKAPARRPQRAEELLTVLEALAANGGGAPPAPRWRRRVAPAAALLAGAVALALLARPRATPPAARLEIGRARQLTFDATLELDPALSPDGEMLAFAQGTPSTARVFVRRRDGDRPVALLPDLPAPQRWPRWSPDGTRLAVETPGGVVIVPALGGRSTVVAGSDTLAPRFGHDWAPDGRRLALAAAGSLYLVDPERGPERLLYRGFWGAYGASVPAFAPDGERVAFVIDNPDFVFGSVANFANIAPSRLAIVRLDGSGPRTILDDGALSTSPAWLPDGRALLYVSSRAGGRDVHRLALDEAGRAAGEPERLTTGASAQTLTLARDGATLAYSRFLSRANVWSLAIPARGIATLDSAVEVTSGSQTVEGFDLSPDGRTLAFDSDREGNQDIYVMSLPDGRVTRLTSDARDDFMPRWSHDGRWLAFHSIRQGARDAFVLRVDGGAPEQVTADPAQDRYPSFAPGDSMLVLESDRRDSTRAAYVVRGRPGLGWGTPERVSPGGGRWPKFSPATGELLYWSDDGIYVRPAGGEAARRIVTGRPYATFWSDDGRTVYYIPIAEDSTSGVWAVPVEGGTPRQLVRFAPDGPQVRRVFFTARNGRFYFSMMQHESDLWSLDLVQR